MYFAPILIMFALSTSGWGRTLHLCYLLSWSSSCSSYFMSKE